MTQQLHVVLGASGGAGTAIVEALTNRGHAVRAVNRSRVTALPDGVERMTADVTDPASLATAVAGAGVVYMAAQPAYHRWPEEFPPMVATLIDAVASEGARLIMVDNLYMYAPSTQPLTETSPTDVTTRKGKARLQLDAMFREAEASKSLDVVIGRASDYFGPGPNMSAVTALAIEPAVKGKSIRWMGRLDKRHSVAYLPDIGRAYATLGESGEASHGTWILPHGSAPTGAEFLGFVNAALSTPARTGVISKMMLTMAAPFNKVSKESLELMYQYDKDFVVDDSKFQEAFGPFATTPLDEAVHETVTSYLARG